jgi:hypothetical protein
MSLTRRHVIAQTNACNILLGPYPGYAMHHSSDKHLACSDGMNLDYCEVMAITGDFNMAIITLDTHYFVLSCHPAPPVALSMTCGQ